LVLLFIHCSKNKNNAPPDLQKGLQAWFKLDGGFAESTSNISSSGHSGTASAVADRKGNAQGAISFEGGFFWFEFPKSFMAIPMSISLWIKAKNVNSVSYLVKASTAAFGIHQINDRIGFFVSTPVTDGFATNFSAQWTHVVGTYDGKDVKVYIDGVYKGSEYNPGVPDPTTRVDIGSFADYPDTWEGTLDDIRFYNRLLSGQEIQLLAQE
jgi:hypothetical protein